MEKLIKEEDIHKDLNGLDSVNLLEIYRRMNQNDEYVISKTDMKYILSSTIKYSAKDIKPNEIFVDFIFHHFDVYTYYLSVLEGNYHVEDSSDEIIEKILYEFDQISAIYLDYAEELSLYHRFWKDHDMSFKEVCKFFGHGIEDFLWEEKGREKLVKYLDELKQKYDYNVSE